MLFPAPICFALQHTATHCNTLLVDTERQGERQNLSPCVCKRVVCVSYHADFECHKVFCSVLQCVAHKVCPISHTQQWVDTQSLLQCVAVWCSVLQCVAVFHTKSARYHTHNSKLTHKLCCSVLQCVAVCCSVSHTKSARYHTHNSKLTHKLCCSVLQRVAVCCSVLQCVAHKVCSISHSQQRVDAQSLPVQRHTKSAVTQTVRRCASESERLCQKVKSDCVRKWSQSVERQQVDTQSVLQCVAVYCNVLKCVAMCCSVLSDNKSTHKVCCNVLQCVAMCCSVLQCVAVCYNVLQCVHRQQGDTQSVLQCVAVCCNVLQCVERLCQKVKSDFVRPRVRECISTKVCTMHTQYILVDLAFITS